VITDNIEMQINGRGGVSRREF